MSFSYCCVEECTVLVCLFAFANLRGILTRKCSMATTGHDHVKSTPQTFPGRPDNQTLPGQSGKGSDFFWWPCWKPPPHPMSTFFFLNTSLCSLEETSSDVLLLGPLLDSWYATSRPAFSMIESGSRKDRRCSAQLLHFLESWQANWGWGPWPLIHRSLQQLLESFRPCKGEVSVISVAPLRFTKWRMLHLPGMLACGATAMTGHSSSVCTFLPCFRFLRSKEFHRPRQHLIEWPRRR